MEKQINYNRVKSDYERNAEHKFQMLRFVPDTEHRKKHSDRASERRQK